MIDSTPIVPEGFENVARQDDLASELCTWIRSWESKRELLVPRWTVIESILVSETPKPSEMPWDGFQWRDIPVLRDKANAWFTYVCEAPTSSQPFLVGTMLGPKDLDAKPVENDFYLFMRLGQWPRIFKRNVRNIGITGKGIWRVRPVEGGRTGFGMEYKAVRPHTFIIYPDVEDGIESARAVGHTFELTVSQVQSMQDRDELYKDVEVHGSTDLKDGPPQVGVQDNKTSIAKDSEDMSVRIAELICRYDFDGEEKWWRVWVAADNPKLLGIWRYRYSRPWYFDQFTHEEQGHFWPETSRLIEAQPIQLATNDQWNFMQAGGIAGAFPVTFASGFSNLQKYARSKPGNIYPTMPGSQVQQVNSRFDPSVMPLLLSDLRRQMSEHFRLDEQALGVKTSGDQTATAANIRQSGTQASITGDLSNLDVCMEEVGAFMQELFRIHYLDFYEAYGDALATKPDEGTANRGWPEILEKTILWQLNGRTPSSIPANQMIAAGQLFQNLAQVANPEAVATLRADGVDTKKLFKTLILNSTLENREALIMEDDDEAPPGAPGAPDPQQQQMDAAQQQAQMEQQTEMAKIQAQSQVKMQEVQAQTQLKLQEIQAQSAAKMAELQKQGELQVLADLAKMYVGPNTPPSTMAQIEQRFGIDPNQHLSSGMPAPGTQRHADIVKTQLDHQNKQADREQEQQSQAQQLQAQQSAQDQQLAAQQEQAETQHEHALEQQGQAHESAVELEEMKPKPVKPAAKKKAK